MGALSRTVGPLPVERCCWLGVICALALVMLSGCGAHRDSGKPSINITNVPRADKGGTAELDTIAGNVVGATGEQQIVLFAHSGAWYVQPFADQPFTKMQSDSTWSNSTHLGTDYAALLVKPGYVPPASTVVLPNEGNGVIAVVVVEGTPPFWDTSWFRLLLALVVLIALLALYRWRLHELSRQLNLRFEERLAERTRIAQDLHDTLLQGVVSASMQLHVANEQLPTDSPAKPAVARVINLMGQVVEEGRDAVRGLRSTTNSNDLEEAFSQIGRELAVDDVKDYRVIVEGTRRELHPVIRDEAYRIGREALSNAFRHSQGNKIELEIEYTRKHLRILVRDNGVGIDQNVLRSGRDGHWGLAGMRERAESIGGRLKVWSRARAGTEVELFIPGHTAFMTPPSSHAKRLFRR